MAQIAYILLCHKAPQAVIEQARLLVSAGDFVAIHYDARAPRAEFEEIRKALADHARIAFAPRVRCGWGEWSLVEAMLGAARTALSAFPEATHFYAISGDCMPIQPARQIAARLDTEAADFIESVDFFEGGWIRTGLREDRLIYRHFFNERSQKRLFYLSLDLQRHLGLRRAIPEGIEMRIGSQWWCLRRATLEAVLDFARTRPGVLRFFRTTWIPDETFFQTIVHHLVPREEIRSRPPTFLIFSDYGMPVTFHNDHYELLIAQDAFFSRKISPRATELRARLAARFAGPADPDVTAPSDGKRLHHFLTGRGREGRRYGPRIWDPKVPGPERRLHLVVCKKWHVAKRLAAAITHNTGLPALHYPFNEDSCPLPGLGGLGSSLEKRNRDRRAFSGAIFEALGTDRLLLCLDPADLAAIVELHGSGSFSRLLEIACTFDEPYLSGHADRIGLGATVHAGVLSALAAELHEEAARLEAAGLANHYRVAPDRAPERNAAALADFLDISRADALEIAATPNLFAD